MSYATVSKCANDPDVQARIIACAAQEGAVSPDRVVWELRWPVVSAADIEAAYASALAADNPAPGADETVITDGMILANVQAHWQEEWEQPTAPPT